VRRVIRVVIAVAVLGLGSLITAPHAAAKPPPVTCKRHARNGQCVVTVRSPGRGSGGNPPGGASGSSSCADNGQPVPCERPGFGSWDPGLGCYVQLMQPQPPKTDPVWKGHTGGAVYLCSVWPVRTTGVTEVWLAAPPDAVDPRVLALQAERKLVLPQPSGHRSPDESHQYDGSPFTYVNLWTWFWTDADMWRARSATARAGGVSATVTVTPTLLTLDPGDGSPAVSCAGPGRPWTAADGDEPPSAGAAATSSKPRLTPRSRPPSRSAGQCTPVAPSLARHGAADRVGGESMTSSGPRTMPMPGASANGHRASAGLSTPLPTSSRPRGYIALAVMLIVGFAALGYWFYAQAGSKVAVLTAAREIPAGHVITASDLSTTDVAGGITAVAANHMSEVVGRTAAVEILPRTPVQLAMVTSASPIAAGQVLVGVAVAPGQIPSSGLTPGETVEAVGERLSASSSW
jgi:SAF domain